MSDTFIISRRDSEWYNMAPKRLRQIEKWDLPLQPRGWQFPQVKRMLFAAVIILIHNFCYLGAARGKIHFSRLPSPIKVNVAKNEAINKHAMQKDWKNRRSDGKKQRENYSKFISEIDSNLFSKCAFHISWLTFKFKRMFHKMTLHLSLEIKVGLTNFSLLRINYSFRL